DAESVSKALEHVEQIVKSVVAAVKPAAEPAKPAAEATPAETTKATEDDAEKAKGKSLAALMDMMGMGDAQKKAAKEKLKAAGFNPNQKFPTSQEPLTSAKKSAEGETEAEEPNMTLDGFI